MIFEVRTGPESLQQPDASGADSPWGPLPERSCALAVIFSSCNEAVEEQEQEDPIVETDIAVVDYSPDEEEESRRVRPRETLRGVDCRRKQLSNDSSCPEISDILYWFPDVRQTGWVAPRIPAFVRSSAPSARQMQQTYHAVHLNSLEAKHCKAGRPLAST